jgi:hypothetical protein
MTIVARRDPGLRAVVVRRWPIFLEGGADRSLDRPAHVRAASALRRHRDRLLIVQDDANFVVSLDPHAPDRARAVAFGDEPVRLFDDARGNKNRKLDLEAAIVLDDALVAFGSGSTDRRERIVVVEDLDAIARIDVRHAPELYERLRTPAFAGSEPNLEGALIVGDRLRFFQRGNGAPRDGLAPVDATADLPLEAFRAHLHERVPLPPLEAITRFDLGALAGVRLTFTDAALLDDRVLYLAAAEASPDAVRDGPVAGVALGLVEDERARYAVLEFADGAPFLGKAEGIVVDGGGGFVVVDPDDPASPAELCAFELRGSW